MLKFERDPTFRMDNVYDLSRSEVRARVMKRLVNYAAMIKNESIKNISKQLQVMVIIDPGFMTRLSVHVHTY